MKLGRINKIIIRGEQVKADFAPFLPVRLGVPLISFLYLTRVSCVNGANADVDDEHVMLLLLLVSLSLSRSISPPKSPVQSRHKLCQWTHSEKNSSSHAYYQARLHYFLWCANEDVQREKARCDVVVCPLIYKNAVFFSIFLNVRKNIKSTKIRKYLVIFAASFVPMLIAGTNWRKRKKNTNNFFRRPSVLNYW